ncbi:MAG: hypothetical protein ACD_78C00196G0002 [uncultured bacterium (gcode 4)]|uniref:Uncharacterized protein n=1 Tax=uncultured bacterium (gcode 4) TaxID=1234023 RepID=K1XI23_9BACT|nr:MAG: hypothetical protein ACD_78C00196G0002 [uncultured bacterium (gcode 4)]
MESILVAVCEKSIDFFAFIEKAAKHLGFILPEEERHEK